MQSQYYKFISIVILTTLFKGQIIGLGVIFSIIICQEMLRVKLKFCTTPTLSFDIPKNSRLPK